MSRERPIEPPRAVPDAPHGKHETQRQRASRENLERLKKMEGPGLIGGLMAGIGQEITRAPRFLRRGYVEGIVDDLNDFYARHPRPWRPASRSACGPTHKERLKMQRRARA